MDVHFFAAARAAAGKSVYSVPTDFAGETLADLQTYLTRNISGATAGGMTFKQVLDQCSFLLDGVASDSTASLAGATRLDVLPPFAGG